MIFLIIIAFCHVGAESLPGDSLFFAVLTYQPPSHNRSVMVDKYKKLPKELQRLADEMHRDYWRWFNPEIWADMLSTINKITNPLVIDLLIKDLKDMLTIAEKQLENIRKLRKFESKSDEE
jgi:hypothetical protein